MAEKAQPGEDPRHYQQPIVQSFLKLPFASMAFTLITATIFATLVSEKFPITKFHYWIVTFLVWSCALLWAGSFFPSRRGLYLYIQAAATILSIQSGILLIAAFLPLQYALYCHAAMLFFCGPFIYYLLFPAGGGPLLVNGPQPDAAAM